VSLRAELLFADPIGDIAVLGSPTIKSCGSKPKNMDSCTTQHVGGPIWITDAAEGIHGGMSGSAILVSAPVVGSMARRSILAAGRMLA
jgi:hypothetical protein